MVEENKWVSGIDKWLEEIVSGLGDFENCMNQGQIRQTGGTWFREIVIQAMKELRSWRGKWDHPETGNCRRPLWLLFWEHNKQKQCPQSRGPGYHGRPVLQELEAQRVLFETYRYTCLLSSSCLVLYSAPQWPKTARSRPGKQRLQSQFLYLQWSRRSRRRSESKLAKDLLRPWEICAF